MITSTTRITEEIRYKPIVSPIKAKYIVLCSNAELNKSKLYGQYNQLYHEKRVIRANTRTTNAKWYQRSDQWKCCAAIYRNLPYGYDIGNWSLLSKKRIFEAGLFKLDLKSAYARSNGHFLTLLASWAYIGLVMCKECNTHSLISFLLSALYEHDFHFALSGLSGM